MYAKSEMINNEEVDISTNYLRMKNYKQLCSIFYIVYAIMYLIYVFVMGVINEAIYAEPNSILISFDAFIIKTGVIFFALMAIFKKNNRYAIIGSIVQVCSLIISIVSEIGTDLSGGEGPNASFTACFLALTFAVYKNNMLYKHLKEQYGFPHFNERQATQDFNKKQREIKDEFQQSYERRMKSSSDEMGDVFKAQTPDRLTSDESYQSEEMELL